MAKSHVLLASIPGPAPSSEVCRFTLPCTARRARPIARFELFFCVAHLAAHRTMRDFSVLCQLLNSFNNAFRSAFLASFLGRQQVAPWFSGTRAATPVRVVEVNSSLGIEHRTVSGRNLAPHTTCYTSFDPRAPHLILRQAYCVLFCVVAQDFRQTAHWFRNPLYSNSTLTNVKLGARGL